ncbi:MAG: DUF4365 domain-containing protein [Candidatus Thiodiazotropha sp. (ex Ctena orbiculata)]|nr:DUF4365 domain-containing protein [Candidatus Thiodiazotropha taylori]
MKKYQSESIHIGNMGEHIITSKLSEFCVVRGVGQGQDTGIDLYCEIIKQETHELSLHFFCQVKTRKRPISNSEIEKNLSYWGNQPVPVYLFLLKYSDSNKLSSNSDIWVYDLPYLLCKNDAKNKGYDGLERNVKDKFLICNENNDKDRMTLNHFIYHHIPFAYGMWYMRRHGLSLPNPKIAENEPDVFIAGLPSIYSNEIQDNISYAQKALENMNR